MSIIRLAGRLAAAFLGVAVLAAGVVATSTPAMAGASGQPADPATPAAQPGSLLPWRLAAPAGQPQSAAIVGDDLLESVFCLARTDCWAVGSAELNNATRNQALHFNGRKWARIPTPSPGGTAAGDSSILDSVWCTSRSNCWAVGSSDTSNGSLTQALHFNGRKWARVPILSPGGTPKGFNDLFNVTCTSAANCWADGDDGHSIGSNDVTLNLVEHWNGRHWSLSRTPEPGGTGAGDSNGLGAIRCTSAKSCWGVGSYGKIATGSDKFENEVLHWKGRKWVAVSVPSPGTSEMGTVESGLNAISCTSANRCWAVGLTTDATAYRSEALHSSDGKWRVVPTPNPSTGTNALSALSDVSCTADTNCWAVGVYDNVADLNQVLHWTGHKWLLVTVPQPGGTASESSNELSADFCVTAKDCWAVGYSQSFAESEKNEFLHFTGRKWAHAGT